MSTDDSRGLESPDRSEAPTDLNPVRTDGGTDRTIRKRIESIDRLTRTLLVDIQTNTAELEHVDAETRTEAARHVREIRAEASHIGLSLFGPEASMPYRPPTDLERDVAIVDRRRSIATTYSGPEPEAFERERQRDHERDEADDQRGEAEAEDQFHADSDANDRTTKNADGNDDHPSDGGDADA